MLNNQIIEAISALADNKTKIRKKDILKVPSIKENPVTQLLLNKYTINGKFDFFLMIEELKTLVMENDLKSKLQFLFNIYDIDNDGYISRLDLFNIVKMFADDNLTNKNIQNIVDRCFLDLNIEFLNFVTFHRFIEQTNPNLRVFMRCRK